MDKIRSEIKTSEEAIKKEINDVKKDVSDQCEEIISEEVGLEAINIKYMKKTKSQHVSPTVFHHLVYVERNLQRNETGVAILPIQAVSGTR